MPCCNKPYPRFHAVCALLAVLLLATPCLAAPEPVADKPTYHASLAAACDAAAINKSMVLLLFGAEWCGPCKMLKKNTLGAEEFAQRGGALRIFEVNIDADEKTTRSFGVSAVPTLFLLTPEGKILARRSGYLDVTEMLKWLEQGRERMKRGEWEGIAPDSSLGGLAVKANTGTLQTNELRQLIEVLARPEPAERLSASRLLLAQREKAVPFLIEALGNSYLGLRINAADLLQKLAPDTPAVDPWQSPEELRESIVKLKDWWARTGQLPPATQQQLLDPSLEASIKSALDEMRGNDPLQRTEAMSTLVNLATAALPKLRESIKAAEGKSDHRTLALLEDVFWAILIPDGVERRAGARTALARGTSPERQQAADRLGRAGRDAIPALAELVNDSDTLVAEHAVRALSKLGGKDSIAVMSALLKAADPNLRMTAAQALGKTKNPDASGALLGVLADANEIVACTALAALEEIFSGGGAARFAGNTETPGALPGLTAALKQTLKDPRWRVRATAAEIAGKLHLAALSDELKRLLDDADGFVVKNTLLALRSLNSEPTVSQLAALIKKLPSLRADALGIMLDNATAETVKAVMEMYDKGKLDERLAILTALARSDRGTNETWKPFLAKTAGSPDPPLRRATAEALATSPLLEASELVGGLLADPDPETRALAAEVLMGIVAGKRKNAHGMGAGWVHFGDEDAGARKKLNPTYATSEKISAWHARLAGLSQSNLDFRIAAALYVTGDGKTDLPVLIKAFDALDARTRKQLSISPAIALILRRLPWPEGKALLEKLASSPAAYTAAALESEDAGSEVRDFLLEPARFQRAVESASGEELMTTLEFLLTGGNSYDDDERKWSLLNPGEPAGRIVKQLLTSSHPAWRAAAIAILGKRDPKSHRTEFEKALGDTNAWVRAAAIKSFAQAMDDRTLLEQRIGPFLGETNIYIAQIAAMALLQPEVWHGASLHYLMSYFYYDGKPIRTQTSFSIESEDRPLAALAYKPAFLEHARKHLQTAGKEYAPIFGLLLAQYGEFDGLAGLAGLLPDAEAGDAEPDMEERPSSLDLLLTSIALSHDPKFVPVLRKALARMRNEYEIRKIIRSLRGMTGPEARELRLEANKRVRQKTTQVSEGYDFPPLIDPLP